MEAAPAEEVSRSNDRELELEGFSMKIPKEFHDVLTGGDSSGTFRFQRVSSPECCGVALLS